MPRAWRPLRVTPASASSGVRPKSVQAMLSISRSEASGDVPGFRSLATAIGTPAARSSSTGGLRRFAEKVGCPRQQHGHRARPGDGPHPFRVEMFEMIDRQRLELGRQPGGAQVGKLLDVGLDRQAVPRGRLENPPALRRREGDPLAEYVHRVGQSLRGRGGENLIANAGDIIVAAAGIFRRHGMRGKQRRGHVDRQVFRQAAGQRGASSAHAPATARSPT